MTFKWCDVINNLSLQPYDSISREVPHIITKLNCLSQRKKTQIPLPIEVAFTLKHNLTFVIGSKMKYQFVMCNDIDKNATTAFQSDVGIWRETTKTQK